MLPTKFRFILQSCFRGEDFFQVGWCEDWVHTNKLTSHSVFSRNSLKHGICARIYVNELIPMLKVFNIQVTTQKMYVFNWK
jgi:hypothetical protein